jgi:polar amino acid transport system substrate-binding protein
VLFVRHGSDITFERDEQLIGRSVCVAAGTDVSSLDGTGRRWVKEELITVLQRPGLAACFAALDHGDADAVFSDDLGGKAVLEQLGIGDKIEVARRPVATLEISAVAAKDNPAGVAALKHLDDGVAALKADGRYASIVLGRLGKQQLSGDVPSLQ